MIWPHADLKRHQPSRCSRPLPTASAVPRQPRRRYIFISSQRRNPESTSAPSSRADRRLLRPNRRAACGRVNTSPGISVYSLRIRAISLDHGGSNASLREITGTSGIGRPAIVLTDCPRFRGDRDSFTPSLDRLSSIVDCEERSVVARRQTRERAAPEAPRTSGDGADDAAVHAQRRSGRRRCAGAADVGDHRRHFRRRREALDNRRWPGKAEEVFFDRRRVDAA
jgi:hypothetical protein